MTMAAPFSEFRPSRLTRLLWKIAAVDEATLQTCPPQDGSHAAGIGALMAATWAYQTVLFCLAGRLFASGEFRPELIAGSIGIATFILLIDQNMVILPNWHDNGIEFLKRAGFDISGGAGAKFKAWFLLAIRILLAVGISQLTAIFVSVLVFSNDISVQVQGDFGRKNAALIRVATVGVDQEIARATDAVKADTERYNGTAALVMTLRQTQVDPSMSSPAAQQLQQEMSQLLERKAQLDTELQQAENFASDELGDLKGSPENSGRPGNAWRHRAALEKVATARRRVAESAKAIGVIRVKLDALRDQSASSTDLRRQQALDQTPEFEKTLGAAGSKLEGLKAQLKTLTQGRDASIHHAVEQAPGYVRADDGLLAQIRIVQHLAETDSIIFAAVLLIDFMSFGFELAAVLSKITCSVPTRYAVIIARDGYMQAIEIVSEMAAKLETPVPAGPAEPEAQQEAADLFGEPGIEPAAPERRPRGRPRKNVH